MYRCDGITNLRWFQLKNVSCNMHLDYNRFCEKSKYSPTPAIHYASGVKNDFTLNYAKNKVLKTCKRNHFG